MRTNIFAIQRHQLAWSNLCERCQVGDIDHATKLRRWRKQIQAPQRAADRKNSFTLTVEYVDVRIRYVWNRIAYRRENRRAESKLCGRERAAISAEPREERNRVNIIRTAAVQQPIQTRKIRRGRYPRQVEITLAICSHRVDYVLSRAADES